MQAAQLEKLEDYLNGLVEIKSSVFFPIGSILVSKKDRTSVLKVMQNRNMAIIEVDGRHPDFAIKEIIENLQRKKPTILDIRQSLHPKLINQLSNIAANRINVQLAGEEQATIINPLPQENFIILLMEEENYDDFPLKKIISSFCNLIGHKK